MPPRLLLTGFGPFPGAPENPTGALIRALARRLRKDGFAVSVHVFRTTYETVDRELPRWLAREKPDALLMFGLATRSRALRIETRARNRIARLPDASGIVPPSRIIEHGGAKHRAIRAPKAPLLRAAQSQGLPARLSLNAGDYLCNYLYWRALATKQNRPRRIAFVHVPQVSERFTKAKLVEATEAITHAFLTMR